MASHWRGCRALWWVAVAAIRLSGCGELWPLLEREWAAHIGSSQEATEMNTHVLLYFLFLRRLSSPDDLPQT